MRCGCRRKQWKCGPRCLYQSCINTDENYEFDSSSYSENDESDIEETSDKFEENEPLEEEIITEDDLYDSTYDY